MRNHLFNTDKLKYVNGDRPGVACILCAIRDRDPDVVNLEVARRDGFIVSVNLYPFNPGHVMIFPGAACRAAPGPDRRRGARAAPAGSRRSHGARGRISARGVQRGLQPGPPQRREHRPHPSPGGPPVRERGRVPGRARGHAPGCHGPGRDARSPQKAARDELNGFPGR